MDGRRCDPDGSASPGAVSSRQPKVGRGSTVAQFSAAIRSWQRTRPIHWKRWRISFIPPRYFSPDPSTPDVGFQSASGFSFLAAVPEASNWLMMLVGLFACAAQAHRRYGGRARSIDFQSVEGRLLHRVRVCDQDSSAARTPPVETEAFLAAFASALPRVPSRAPVARRTIPRRALPSVRGVQGFLS